MTKLLKVIVVATGVFAFIAVLFAPLQAQLQTTNADVKNAVDDTDTAAYQKGYQDGWIEGEAAWAHSGGPKLNESSNYKKADHGYIDSSGDKNVYKDLYRRGFVDGYSRGYGINFTEKENVTGNSSTSSMLSVDAAQSMLFFHCSNSDDLRFQLRSKY